MIGKPFSSAVLGLVSLVVGAAALQAADPPTLVQVIRDTQPKIVKIYGAGGLQGLETYQSGFLISAEGHILTVWSYVLDSSVVTCVLGDGRKFEATLAGIDPVLEIALLKIEAKDLPYFNLDAAAEVPPGSKVLAFSNLYNVAIGDEPASVLHGLVSAKTKLAARRGAYATRYQGEAYVLDAMTNNPGAAGGALTDRRGRLLGLLGKELKSSLNNTWLNYAIPISALNDAVADLKAGRSRPQMGEMTMRPKEHHTATMLGVVLVPDVLDRTPPFIDRVQAGSIADKAGLKPDDLVIFIGGRIVQSCKQLADELAQIDRIDPVKITVLRNQELVEVELNLP